MSSNVIVTRVKDFLKKHPPYSYLPDTVLMEIAAKVQIFYFQDDEYIFKEGQENKQLLYVLKKGKVELLKEFDNNTELIDICEEGDVFGVRSSLTGNSYVASARSSGDSLVYGIPQTIAQSILNEYPQVSLFFAAGFASGQTIIHTDSKGSKQARKDLLQLRRNKQVETSSEDVLVLKPTKDIVSCTIETTIREAAILMKARRIGSIIVLNEQRHPIGIVSDSDFTRKVIAGTIHPDASVTELMNSPVVTLPPNTSIARFTISSIRSGARRIVITEDGTTQTPVVGILSERDVLSMKGNNPGVLVKRILKARSISKLKELRDRADSIIINYLEQEISIEFVTDITTEINDALIHKAIEMSLKRLKEERTFIPNLKWTWLSLGSEGRGEQLLRTDQDNAIVYENPKEEDEEAVKDYFLTLGTYIVDILIKCGFERCQGDIMASNPKWTQPMSGWKSHFKSWLNTPDPNAVMNGNIFFDFRSGYGGTEMTNELSEFIFEQVDKRPDSFATFFVSDATSTPPPLSFFKNFVVEKTGNNKDLFDIKKRAMMPLASSARVLCIADKIKGLNNTFERYRKLAELHPNQQAIFEEAAEAYEIFIRHRALNGFRNKSSGRFISPKNLNKIERETLRTAFKSIEEVQQHLKLRFNLNYM